jgi:hypothetical protein
MSIIVTNKGGDSFEKPTAGLHSAVCSGVIDLGMQPNMNGTPVPKVAILWELDQRIQADGEFKNKRLVQSKDYTASFNEKANLRKDIESWQGKSLAEFEQTGFDVEQLVGMNCQLNLILHKSTQGKEYMKIAAVLPGNSALPPMVVETPGYIPQWIKDKMPKTDTQVAPQTQQKPQMTREGFDTAVDKILLLPADQHTAAFDILRSNMNKAKLEGRCSEALFAECKLNWEMSSGRKFDGFKDFDDCDLF